MILTTTAAAAAHHLPLLLSKFPSVNSSKQFRSPTSRLVKLSFSISAIECAFGPEIGSGDSSSGGGGLSPASAAAVAAAIRRASPSSPVEFERRVGKESSSGKNGTVLPSPDFQRLCAVQLDLFRMTVHPDAVLSVYVRPAGSYVMDQLELRRSTCYPGIDASENADSVTLIANFPVPAGLRATEAALSKQQVDVIAEFGALVLPMVKNPFVVGFLVAEIPVLGIQASKATESDIQLPQKALVSSHDDSQESSPYSSESTCSIQPFGDHFVSSYFQLTAEQKARAIMISCSLAAAYVMDQKALLLQKLSWHTNVRMNQLVEQIRGPLSSIRALSQMLSVQVKKSEIAHDIIEDILVQGDHMREALQNLQDAVYITKANIVRYNEDTLNKRNGGLSNSGSSTPELTSNNFSERRNSTGQKLNPFLPSSVGKKDIEMPMPPLLLAPIQQNIVRPCVVSDVITELVEAALPLAKKQQKALEIRLLSEQLQVAVEESALRQALSNLVEGALLRTSIGGQVEIYATGAPAGGALVVIDDNGPDMQYMTQMRSLMPFGLELVSDGTVEDNMTWNFVAGLTVAREILESFGCVIRVISPRVTHVEFSAGGTRVELWLPSPADSMRLAQEA